MKQFALVVLFSSSLIFVESCSKENKYCWSCYVFAVPNPYEIEYCDKTEEEIEVIRNQFNKDHSPPTNMVMLECKKK